MPLLQPISAWLRLKLGKVLATVLASIILVAILGPVIAVDWLRSPYFQIVFVALYWLCITGAAASRYDCFRAARTPEQKSQLQLVTFSFVATVLWAGTHIVTVFRTEDRDHGRIATDFGMMIALGTALKMVAALLKAASPTLENSKVELPAVPIPDLSQNPAGISASGL